MGERNEYKIILAGKANSVEKNILVSKPCFREFQNYNGHSVGMYRLCATLNNTGWTCVKQVIDSNSIIYTLYSNKYNSILELDLSTTADFKETNSDFNQTVQLLNSMSKNATIVNNKVIQFPDSGKSTIKPGKLRVYPTAKRVLSKQKIALATVTAALIVIVGGTVFASMNDYVKEDGSISNSQNYNENTFINNYDGSPVEGVSQDVYNKSVEIARNNHR